MSTQSVGPITDTRGLIASLRGTRPTLVTRNPRYRTMEQQYDLLHSCHPYFLTAPLRYQMKNIEQMPNVVPVKDVREGRIGILALNAILENCGLDYDDLGDTSKRKALRAAGIWGLGKLKRGPKARG